MEPPISPNQADFDPWSDTQAERGPERRDLGDEHRAEGPLGSLSELLGVPNLTPRSQAHGDRPSSKRVSHGLLVALFAILLVAVIVATALAAF